MPVSIYKSHKFFAVDCVSSATFVFIGYCRIKAKICKCISQRLLIAVGTSKNNLLVQIVLTSPAISNVTTEDIPEVRRVKHFAYFVYLKSITSPVMKSYSFPIGEHTSTIYGNAEIIRLR